jgi:processive 1,2-diacylglycerol beta-glucosyltransferase
VAIDETRAHLEALGLPRERITVSGIPIDPVFAEPVNRAAAFAEYGLDAEKTTLLLSAGALGVSPTEIAVVRLMQLRHDTQTIVVCGKSEETRARVTAIVGENNARFKILGYTDRMHDLMKISDLFVGKPGGLTTSESLACGLPMAIISPIPGQEERNSDHLLEDGAAIKCNEMTTLPFKIDRLLDDPARLAAMKQSAKKLGRPDAARTIARTLIEDSLPPMQLNAGEREAIAHAASGEIQ